MYKLDGWFSSVVVSSNVLFANIIILQEFVTFAKSSVFVLPLRYSSLQWFWVHTAFVEHTTLVDCVRNTLKRVPSLTPVTCSCCDENGAETLKFGDL